LWKKKLTTPFCSSHRLVKDIFLLWKEGIKENGILSSLLSRPALFEKAGHNPLFDFNLVMSLFFVMSL
jgi:hypothetical protein